MNFMSEQINELMKALAVAQKKILPAYKNKANTFHKSVYADLDSIWDACREPLSDNGLAVSQLINQNEKGMILITILGHTSGQWMKSEMPISYKMGDKVNENQVLGSSLTYCRRYALAAIAGVATSDVKPEDGFDEDDDAELAGRPVKTINPSPITQKQEAPRVVITKAQRDELMAILQICPKELRDKIERAMKNPPHNAKGFDDIPANAYDKLMSYISEEMKKT